MANRLKLNEEFEFWYEYLMVQAERSNRLTNTSSSGVYEGLVFVLYNRKPAGELEFLSKLSLIGERQGYSTKIYYLKTLETAVEIAIADGKLPDRNFNYSARIISERSFGLLSFEEAYADMKRRKIASP